MTTTNVLRCPECNSANLNRNRREDDLYCLNCGFFPIPPKEPETPALKLGWSVSANLECLALDIMAGQDPVFTLEDETAYREFMQVMMDQAGHFGWSLLAGRQVEGDAESGWVMTARFLFDGDSLVLEPVEGGGERLTLQKRLMLRDEGAFHQFVRALSFAARQLRWAPAPSPWISVETAMPEPGNSVLTWAKEAHDQVVVRTVTDSGNFWRGRGGLVAVKAGFVTHWQPVPAGPVVEGESDD